MCARGLSHRVYLCSRKWQPQTKDDSMPFAPLDKALVEYQDPRKVDKIMRIQQDLEETKDVLVRRAPYLPRFAPLATVCV